MKRKKAEDAILDIGRRMYERGFVAANDGNISIRLGKDLVLATPSGVSKGFMKRKMLVLTDLNGNVIEGGANGKYKPSSELKMHLRAYKENSTLVSVCHVHPPFCTAYSVTGLPLNEPVLAEAILNFGEIPVTPYAELGSDEVPEAIAPYVNTHPGVILGNHGAVTWADDPYKAFYLLESMEHYAKILLLSDIIVSKSGDAPLTKNHLTNEQIERLIEMRKNF